MRTTLIKICGLSTDATLTAALEAGADMVGLVFFPKSPRHLDLAAAGRLAAQARGRAVIVALAVDPEDAMLAALMAKVAPDALQLHGRETPDRVRRVRDITGRPVIKALGIRGAADLADTPAYAAVADRLLFDAKPPGDAILPGGNGQSFDWTLLAGLDLTVPFMLSGGLTIGNVDEAIRVTGTPAVDVSSGVESAPGVKDAGKIRAFVEAVRGRG